MRNQGQIGPKGTWTTDTSNTLRVPLSTMIPTGRSIFLQQSKPRSFTESVPWWLTSCNELVLRSEIPSGKCAKLHTMAASNNRDHPTRSLYYCLFAPHIYSVFLHAHSVRGESHIQRNANRPRGCNIYMCQTFIILLRAGPKIMPGRDLSAVRKSLPTPGVEVMCVSNTTPRFDSIRHE